ncbi:MAG: homocysteine S-methyltransferase family protein [Defluviitaleaceae bacterium]|nr:homocysteine S-methyltransferase family protein [Defluviitaleaceae bacterium]
MQKIQEALTKGRIFIDGAMGTELYKRGLTQDPATVNETNPQDIIAIHKEYLAAGADIITSNTFGTYSHKYENYAALIESAMDHGRTALEGQANKWLALDLGPTGQMLEPYGNMTEEECLQIYRNSVQAGAPKADLIIIETMISLTEMEIAVTAAKESNLPIFATMTFDAKGRTMMGDTMASMVELLTNLGVSAIGMNCGFGPDMYQAFAAELATLTTLPVVIQPNAGLPDAAGKYNLPPDAFAEAMKLVGAQILGGCCGTSPAHIAAMVKARP